MVASWDGRAEKLSILRATGRLTADYAPGGIPVAGVIDNDTFERIHIHLRQRREALAEFPAPARSPAPSEAILEVLPVEEPPVPVPVAAAETARPRE